MSGDPILAFAVLRSISPPFNAGETSEVKLVFKPIHTVEGEIFIRVPAARAADFSIGDIYSVCLQRVPLL